MNEEYVTIDTDLKLVKIRGRVLYSAINQIITNTDEEHADEYFIEPQPTIIRYEMGESIDVT